MLKNGEAVKAEYPEILRDMADQVEALLKGAGVEPAKAESIGMALMEHMRKHWSKQPIYIAEGKMDVRRRHEAIYKAFTGDNHEALAKEHGLSVPHIYVIVKAMQREEFRRRQPALFDEEE